MKYIVTWIESSDTFVCYFKKEKRARKLYDYLTRFQRLHRASIKKLYLSKIIEK